MVKSKDYLYLLSEYVLKQHKIDDNTPHEIIDMNAIDLLVPERIDLAAKLSFIDAHETGQGIEEAEELYRMHIEAFTGGIFTEYGNRAKNSYEKYKETFLEIMASIKKSGFRSDISLIPIGDDNIAIGGAHRIACAIYYNKKIRVVKFPHIKVKYDYEYFRDALLKEKYIIKMAEQFVKYKENTFLTFIWPKGYRMNSIVFDEFKKRNARIVYKNKFQLDYSSYWELIHKIYKDEEWIGNEKNNYIGVTQKALFSYEPHGKLLSIVVCGIDQKNALDFKIKVREEIGHKKRSLHTTDNREETLEVLPFLFEIESLKKEKFHGKFYYFRKKIRFVYTHLLIIVKKKLKYPI